MNEFNILFLKKSMLNLYIENYIPLLTGLWVQGAEPPVE